METTKFISISTQKGGGGKSTVTELLASFFAYSAKKKVEVFDCDYPQYTIFKDREEELKELEINPSKKALWEKLNMEPYPVHQYSFDTCLEEMEKRLEDSCNTDYVFIDLPGTIKDQTLLSIVSGLDYLFIPVIASHKEMRSSLEYALTIKEHILGKFNLNSMHLFWNRFNRYSDNEYFEATMALCEKQDISIMNKKLEDSTKFNKSEFISTILPFQKKFFSQSNVIPFIQEFVTIINNQKVTSYVESK